MHSGSCMCGAITFTVEGDLPQPDVCHCSKCRKQSGHCFASTDVPKSALSLSGTDALKWFQSSQQIRRGFCGECGSSLFWEPSHRDWIAVAMGAFDRPTGTTVKMHIFVGEKGDYYQIADRLPQHRVRRWRHFFKARSFCTSNWTASRGTFCGRRISGKAA